MGGATTQRLPPRSLGVLFLVGRDCSFNSIQGRALDTILEPVDLQGLVERFNTVLGQVSMLIMLLNVKGHILVEVEVLSVTLISEGLELVHNGASTGCDTITAEKSGMQDSPHLPTILALDLLHVGPPA